MCAININEFDGKAGINKQHDKNINPEEVLLNSTKPQFCDNCHHDPGGDIPPNTEIDPAKLFGKITDLANEYMIYALKHKNDFNLDDTPDRAQPIMMAPPWEQSNELFDSLSQYTGIQASDKKVSDLKNFFYSIMKGNAQDPNGDGTQDVKDVFAIWGGSNPGDDPLTKIQDLSKKLLEDPYNYLTQIPKLGKALAEYTNTEYDLGKADNLFNFFLRDKSDLTGDGVIDSQDVIKFWKDMDKPTKGDINEDGNIDESDVRELGSDLWLGDMNYDGKLDQEDYKLLEERLNPVPVPLEGEYGRQSVKDEMIRPWPPIRKGDLNHDGTVDRKDLEQLGKVLKSGDMDDDGKVDQKDLELLIEQVRGGEDTKLPPQVRIDFGNDKKLDYYINDGKIFQRFDDYIKEVDHIDGVDLKELAKEIKKNIGDPDEVPFPSFDFKFDINHDGIEDRISSPEYLIQNKGQVDS